jgi:Malic enzyme, NAD binding domain
MTHFRPPMHCRRSAPARLGDVRRGPHYSSELARCFREVLSTPVQPRIDAAMPAGALLCRGGWRLSTGCVRATVGRSDRMFAGAWCVHVSRSRSYEFDCVDLCGSEPLLSRQPPRPAPRRRLRRVHRDLHRNRPPVGPERDAAFRGLRARTRPRHPRPLLAGLLRLQRRRPGHRRGRDGRGLLRIVAGTAMNDQTLVVFSSGTAGVDIADQLRDAMIADGVTQEQATSLVWLVDKQVCCSTTWTTCAISRRPTPESRRQTDERHKAAATSRAKRCPFSYRFRCRRLIAARCTFAAERVVGSFAVAGCRRQAWSPAEVAAINGQCRNQQTWTTESTLTTITVTSISAATSADLLPSALGRFAVLHSCEIAQNGTRTTPLIPPSTVSTCPLM